MHIIISLTLTLFIFISQGMALTYGADWRSAPSLHSRAGLGGLEEGDRLYAHRNHEGEEQKSLEGAIKKYEEALASVPKEEKETLFGIYLRLARANYLLAGYFLKGETELDVYKKGHDYADEAIKINDKVAEAYYWRGISVGSYRDKKPLSGMGGLFGGGIKKDFEQAMRLDENCVYGGPHRLLALFHLAKDETEEAYVHASRAVEITPDFLLNQLVLAEVLWKLEQKTQSAERLNYILSRGPGVLPDALIENRDAVNCTERILEDIRNKKEPRWE